MGFRIQNKIYLILLATTLSHTSFCEQGTISGSMTMTTVPLTGNPPPPTTTTISKLDPKTEMMGLCMPHDEHKSIRLQSIDEVNWKYETTVLGNITCYVEFTCTVGDRRDWVAMPNTPGWTCPAGMVEMVTPDCPEKYHNTFKAHWKEHARFNPNVDVDGAAACRRSALPSDYGCWLVLNTRGNPHYAKDELIVREESLKSVLIQCK